LTGRLPDLIESDLVVRKEILENSNRFGTTTIELTLKIQKTSIFVESVIYEDVHSIKLIHGG
jgi:hypothetical protein